MQIADTTLYYTAEHLLRAAERIVQNDGGGAIYLISSQLVQIGDNAWIGGNTVIMTGMTNGNNVTIEAASLVTKNLPSNVLAFGSPCRVVR